MISLICAQDRNGLIGVNGTIPWHRPKDLKNFKRLTVGNTVIMGRKTYESIGKPLPKRENVVITRHDELYKDIKGKIFFSSLDMCKSVLMAKQCSEEIFVVGGGLIYKELSSFIERMYITVINEKISPDGEAIYFPWSAFAGSKWTCSEQRPLGSDFFYVFERYQYGSTTQKNRLCTTP